MSDLTEIKKRVEKIETSVAATRERVFDGLSSDVAETKERVKSMEKKLNWIFITFSGALITLIFILVRSIL